MNDIGWLSSIFVGWKTLIFAIGSLAPGPGYDTSATLVPSNSKFLRWDAIYFTHIAEYGHVFEQEWAFGKGVSTLLTAISGQGVDVVTAGLILSHVSHFVSVVLLWRIAATITKKRAPAFIAACLHIISPAGIFLSAPYAEAPFAALNMLGYWLWLSAPTLDSLEGFVVTVMSGISFALATTVRSNGILSGLVFLIDAIAVLGRGKISLSIMVRFLATIIAGIYVGIGLVIPQFLAYREYCTRGERREWCNGSVPQIYSFVQSHYWNVGFLRYWKISNIPLFLLATPMISLMVASSVDGIRRGKSALRLAAPQLVLALLAITNYHVQIITRLSSGYPWHYIWLAEKVLAGDKVGRYAVGFFVIYGTVQGGLFASFLPPA